MPSRPLPSDTFWVTVGGGLEPGETFDDAARREVWEETGIRDFELGAWVWVGDMETDWQGEPVRVHQRFYIGRAGRTEVALDRLTDLERGVYRAHRWWSVAEMRVADETFLPIGLPDLLADLLAGRQVSVVHVR